MQAQAHTALYLAERGYDVHIVESNRAGWGASGRNGGQFIGGIAGEKNIAKHLGQDVEDVFSKLRWAGNDIICERVLKNGCSSAGAATITARTLKSSKSVCDRDC